MLSIAAAPPAITERSGKNQPTAPSRNGACRMWIAVKAAHYSTVQGGINVVKATATHTTQQDDFAHYFKSFYG